MVIAAIPKGDARLLDRFGECPTKCPFGDQAAGEAPLLPTATASVFLFLNGGTALIEQCGDVSLDVLQNFSRKGRCSLRDRP